MDAETVARAADRLRKIEAGEPAQGVYGSENAIYTAGMLLADRDAVLADALPLYDTEPVTEDWLRSTG